MAGLIDSVPPPPPSSFMCKSIHRDLAVPAKHDTDAFENGPGNIIVHTCGDGKKTIWKAFESAFYYNC